MARAPPPLLALKKQVNGGSIMIQDELRALYDQMSDEEKNENVHGETTVISTPESKVKVIVLPTNEELAIARETAKLV